MEEAKKEYIEYFNDLVSVYSKLHQLPKFFVKFLLALTETVKNSVPGEIVNKSQLFPEIQNSLAVHFQELSFGQSLELWKIFTETYTSFANLSEQFSSGKGALFLFAQLFSLFLQHSKLFDTIIPESTYEKFGDLIKTTTEELSKNMFELSEEHKKAQFSQMSFLLLCYALGEVKFAYDFCGDKPLNKSWTLKFPNNSYDCSVMHPFLNDAHTDIFESFLGGDDKVISLLVFKLILQKLKGLLSKNELTAEEESHIQQSISVLIHHVRENSQSNSEWDLDLCSLDVNNYGSAVWREFVKLCPLLLNSFSNKHVLAICTSMHDIILESPCVSSEFNLSFKLQSSLRDGYFFESGSFQSAYVASLWNFGDLNTSRKRSCDEVNSEQNSLIDVLDKLGGFRSKWIKYAETTPKCNNSQELNPLWSHLKDACSLLNQVLLTDFPRSKIKLQLFNRVKLVGCIPLEYLLPGNQMQCLVNLSILFFLIPETFNKPEALTMAEEIAMHIVTIIDGVRSKWLFDFVSSGPFFKEIINTLMKLEEKAESKETWPWAKHLLDRIIRLISINSTTFSGIEYYLSQLEKSSTNMKYSVTVSSMLHILEKIAQLYKRAHVQADLKETCHKVFNLSCSYFLKLVKHHKNSSDENILKDLLACFMAVLEVINSSDCPVEPKIQKACLESVPSLITFSKNQLFNNEEDHTIYLKFISKMCDLHQSLSPHLPENFPNMMLEAVLQHLKNKSFELPERTISNEDSVCDHLCDKCSALSHISCIPISFEEHETEALKSICAILPADLLDSSLNEVCNEMIKIRNIVSSNEACTLQINLIILQHLIEAYTYQKDLSLQSEPLLKVLLHLHNLVNNTCSADFYLFAVKIPILDLLNFITLKRELELPKQIIVGFLHFCLLVKIDDLTENIPNFLKGFNSVWSIVYNLILLYPNSVLYSKAAYLSFVSMLLTSTVKVGSQDKVLSCDADTKLQIQSCAQNMNRLLTAISRYEKELSKLVPYLIADYVDTVQHITLETSIKVRLMSGLKNLLDIMSEHSFRMLAVNIKQNCRDILSNFVQNYKQQKYYGNK